MVTKTLDELNQLIIENKNYINILEESNNKYEKAKQILMDADISILNINLANPTINSQIISTIAIANGEIRSNKAGISAATTKIEIAEAELARRESIKASNLLAEAIDKLANVLRIKKKCN